MANRKVDVVVRLADQDCLIVWCDGRATEIVAIEGVASASLYCKSDGPHKFWIRVDPRYDREDVRQDIIDKFSVPIPDVFKEALDENAD